LLSKNIKFEIYRTTILPVLFEYETWSVTVREECRLRVFRDRVLREIVGLRREEVTGDWRKLHNEELHDLYCLPDVWCEHIVSGLNLFLHNNNIYILNNVVCLKIASLVQQAQ
jgi:hypothetical protein